MGVLTCAKQQIEKQQKRKDNKFFMARILV